ncbi:MAG: SAM-dependent methyltransferase, partial [Proteobacteria bacterium]|nr:SAM-dependent methyltransferase [Pseudomonadota bacterium]
GGVLILSLRHGPVPSGRRMFEVSAQETVDLAREGGLACVVNTRTASVQRGREDIAWTRLAFRRD